MGKALTETVAARKKRLANLRPFKKGDPRINRKGQPKLPDLREVLERVLGTEGKDGKTAIERIMETTKRMAEHGNIRATDLLLDRGFGKPAQHITTENVNYNVTPSADEVKQIKKALDKKI